MSTYFTIRANINQPSFLKSFVDLFPHQHVVYYITQSTFCTEFLPSILILSRRARWAPCLVDLPQHFCTRSHNETSYGHELQKLAPLLKTKLVVRQAGLEPATQGLWVLCSNQLSYCRILYLCSSINHFRYQSILCIIRQLLVFVQHFLIFFFFFSFYLKGLNQLI